MLRFWKKSDVANEPVSVPLPPSGRRPLIAGNWKMNYTHLEAIGLTQKLAFSLTPEQFAAAEMAVLPPFISIRSVQTLIDGDRIPIKYGAQDLSPHDSGAYTGDVSGPMLAKLGCTYVIVGHSERRQYHAEDRRRVNAKLVAAFRNGLTPILCVGEPLPVREAQDHIGHCRSQLEGALVGVPPTTLRPSWWPTSRSGRSAPARWPRRTDAQEVCAALRAQLGELYSAELADEVRILYGGSVKAGQRGRDPGPARHRRRAGRRSEPRRRPSSPRSASPPRATCRGR